MNYQFNRNLLLSTIGFDRLIDSFEQMNAIDNTGKSQSYPPYNILKISERHYAIELAIAGFKSEEIDITAEGNKLTVVGKTQNRADGEYLHKGIANRDFSHQFTLAETVVVRSAEFENGLLVIKLENVIPEEKLPRKIMIGGDSKYLVSQDKDKIAA
jgi:molecular chaperone IbpA